ncbi:MAG: hypothetical protein RL268_2760, partial [Pseudomonadota bacterium]
GIGHVGERNRDATQLVELLAEAPDLLGKRANEALQPVAEGRGEAVTGLVMMLIGENSREVVGRVKERLEEIQTTMPEGVKLEVTYDRSALIGKPLPEFALPAALPGQPGLARKDMADGKVRVLNIFASWCVPCAVEAPQLAELRAKGVDVVGVAIRDRPEDLAAFLARHGNPFSRIGADNLSAIQFALGSSGVPESFVIDGKGVIRYQHIGEIRPEQVPLILEKVREAGE